jgi:exodeoxyribonuclease III
MKIITWNCQGAFRKKAGTILAHNPDILVIQECENLEKLESDKSIILPENRLWLGDNKHKVIGIFSNEKFKLTIHESYNPDIKHIVPIVVKAATEELLLFAIWANNKEDKDGQYVEQIWKAIHHYEPILKNQPSILTGDFNSNSIWDRPKRKGNHSHVVEKLAQNSIHSIYHQRLNQVQGKEEHPTFYLYKNQNKPYHIDYCFVSNSLFEKVKTFEVGTYNDWIPHSDHVPLIVEFESILS